MNLEFDIRNFSRRSKVSVQIMVCWARRAVLLADTKIFGRKYYFRLQDIGY